jgi:hypothetical protein
MIKAFTGNQIGPRQFELPPKHPAVGLRRQIRNAVFLTFYEESIGLPFVEFGEGTDAIRAEKFLLVEQFREHPGATAPGSAGRGFPARPRHNGRGPTDG